MPYGRIEILSRIKTQDGIYGVEGNHDTCTCLFPAMKHYGMHPLDNSGTHIKPGFYLCGVHDLWNRKPDVALATAKADEGDFILLVSHNPNVAIRQDTTKVDLMLSGHTHGGHVTFLGLWAPVLFSFFGLTGSGQKFRSGWVKAPCNTNVLVSNGVGGFWRVPRSFAPPQVIFLTLKAK